jgi:hypothetical protein
VACAIVGLFWHLDEPPLVPDAMLSLDVKHGNLRLKKYNTYLLWVKGKPPEVVIEIVANPTGGEDTHKKRLYARIGVKYYVIFDPDKYLHKGVLRAFSLRGGVYKPLKRFLLKNVGLGLMLWEGNYEMITTRWLRWCDEQGNPIPTDSDSGESEFKRAENERERAKRETERAESERERADAAEERLRQLQERLRAAGNEPPA